MKRLMIFFIFVLMAGISSSGVSEEIKRVAKIVDLKGAAEVKSKEGDWIAAEIEMSLSEGDILRTKINSWVLLNVDGKGNTATVEIEENSQLLLSELIEDEEQGTQSTLLDLAIGKVLIKARKLHSEKEKFEVKTPTSIVGVRGTNFAVEVEALEP